MQTKWVSIRCFISGRKGTVSMFSSVEELNSALWLIVSSLRRGKSNIRVQYYMLSSYHFEWPCELAIR